VGHKKRDTFICVITLANIDRFSYFFTAIYNNELRNKNLLKLRRFSKAEQDFIWFTDEKIFAVSAPNPESGPD